MDLWYDIFLLLVLFGGMLTGFAMGLVRQLINIGALYFGLLFASYYHPAISRWARSHFGTADSLARDAMLFFLVFGLIWLFINLGAYISFRTPPRFLPGTLDRLAGMTLGIFTGVMTGIIFTLLMSYATGVPWPDHNYIRVFIQEGIQLSHLKPFFLTFIPVIANVIEPLLPYGLPAFMEMAT